MNNARENVLVPLYQQYPASHSHMGAAQYGQTLIFWTTAQL